MSSAPVTGDVRMVLQFLYDLNEGAGGYELHAVPGWAGVREIGEATKLWGTSDALKSAVRRGLVERADARVPGTRSAHYVYRISPGGAEQLGRPPGRVSPPRPGRGRRRVYLTPGSVAALDALRAAREHPAPRERVPGQPEWRTSLELTTWLQDDGERRGVARVFFPDELQRLVRYRLVERRSDDAGHAVYRLSESAAELEPLEWREPTPRASGEVRETVAPDV